MEVRIENIVSRGNLERAYSQVVGNKGSSGVDEMEVEELKSHLKEFWQDYKKQLLTGTYNPSLIRRVSIGKPGGGLRHLGIPTVLDRMIQHSISQELVKYYDTGFSANSYGFRPGRNAHQALEQSLSYVNEGYEYLVSIDLSKFFDRVHHDRLMSRLSKDITDKEVLRLIRRYLQSGIMIEGVVHQLREGTPQGGNLSPILSNIVLDELDKELEGRRHKFVRYADDISIYVKSRRAGERVLKSVSNWIEKVLRLKVNTEKSGVYHCTKGGLLGYGFYKNSEGYVHRVLPKSLKRFKAKLRKVTSRRWSMSFDERVEKERQIIQGWINYYGLAKCKSHMKEIDKWLRRRFRQCIWKTWKLVRTRMRNLIKLGIPKKYAYKWANTRKGYWAISKSPILTRSIPNKLLDSRGYRSLVSYYEYRHSDLMNRRDTRTVRPVV
ncbi:MAG: group II intron reverse transcriptase/maturase [Bacteroidota bacterium]